MVVDVVENCLEGESGTGVGSEGVLGRRDDVVGGEMGHELLVDDGVEDLCDDWKERYWSVVGWVGFVFALVELDDFGDFEGVRVAVFVDGFVE